MTADLLILAGGKGTRLRKVVPHCPKPLAPIAGVPFLDRQIQFFRQFSCIDKIILAVGYKKESIIEKYQDKGFLFSEEEEPLGTGGALKKGALLSQKKQLFVANGDTFLDCNIDHFLHFHLENHADFSFCTVYQEDSRRYGRIKRNASFRVDAFLEKTTEQEGGWINAGLYLVNREFLSCFNKESFSLEEELPTLLDKRIFGYSVAGFFLDIGTEESYYQAQRIWQNE